MISLTCDVDDKDIVETDREHRWEMSSRTELERPHDVAVELVRRQRLERRDADALAPGAAVERRRVAVGSVEDVGAEPVQHHPLHQRPRAARKRKPVRKKKRQNCSNQVMEKLPKNTWRLTNAIDELVDLRKSTNATKRVE